MKTVAFVPIKLNNERLPNKNIKSFKNGKPLLHYILNTLLKVQGIDEIYVFCSDNKVSEYLPEGVSLLLRDDVLDKSETKINEVISAFINNVEADVYLLAHATSPFIKADSITAGLIKVVNEGYDSALAVQKNQDFLWENNEPLNYDPSNIARTQDLTPLYSETCGFYIFEKEIFNKYNRRVGFNPYLVEVNKVEGMDIDVKEDFDIANAIFNYYYRDK